MCEFSAIKTSCIVILSLAVLSTAVSSAIAPTEIFSFRVGDYGHQGVAVAVDAAGNSYVVGSHSTFSSGPFPITENAFQKTRASMFVTKVDARGERTLWASFLGGSRNRNWYWRGALDYPIAIATDPAGNVFVIGNTAALDFPVENAAVSTPQATGSEGFLTKISADGTRILYSTYLGAYAAALAVDATGNAYVGISNTNDKRLPFERRDLSPPGISGAVVVAKFNPAGQPVLATRLGTPQTTLAAIATDATGAIVIAGSTNERSVPFVQPITSSCFQQQYVGCTNPYVVKLDPTGTQFVYSTFLGGSTAATTMTSLALDPTGAAYVAGATRAADYPLRDAYQRELGGGDDYVLTKISAAGQLVASTRLGGDADETAIGAGVPRLLVDLNGRATLLGATASLSGVVAELQHPDVPLWRSDDDGRSWSASSTGLRTSVWTFAVSERDRTWYAGAIDGVYRSEDGARTWQRATSGVPETFALAVDPAHPGTVYAGTRAGTYRTGDRGQTWTRVDADSVLGGPYHPASHPALVVDGNATVFLGTEGVRRSVDGGRTWIDSSNGFERGPTGRYGPVGPLVFDPNVPGTIYALHGGSRAYRSRDGGATWARLDPAYPPGNSYGIRDFYGVGIPPGRPGRLYVSGWTEVLRSDNDGAEWRTVIDRQLYRARFLLDPARPEKMYAFDSWSGAPLLVSYDGGDSWAMATVPRPDQRVFALDPLQPGSLFAPAGIRSLPVLVTFDADVRHVVHASFLDPAAPSAAAMDLAGAIYLLRPVDGRTLLVKLQMR